MLASWIVKNPNIHVNPANQIVHKVTNNKKTYFKYPKTSDIYEITVLYLQLTLSIWVS